MQLRTAILGVGLALALAAPVAAQDFVDGASTGEILRLPKSTATPMPAPRATATPRSRA